MNTYNSLLTLNEIDDILKDTEAIYSFSYYDVYSLADEYDTIAIYPIDYNTKYQYVYAIGWTVMKDTWDKLMLKRKEEK